MLNQGGAVQMGKEGVKQQVKQMIGELVDDTKASCDVKYIMEELYKQNLMTKDELDQIMNIFQTKKE
ncbi:hypothetical protein ACFQZ1_07880 [Bacillus sp. CGMCC 1.60114]|uniref:hypothetical protein n=1 Tax=unclassified Bacillus (in: firmicutes) TaxID=185979 RepID=UPI00363649BD